MLARINRDPFRRWILIALTVMFGLQMLRVLFPTFVYYLRDSLGFSSMSLAPITLAIFSLSFLATPLVKLLGAKSALAVAAGGVAIVRLLEQFSYAPSWDIYLASLGVVLFLLFLPIMYSISKSDGQAGTVSFGFGVMLGLSVDMAIHALARTLDLSWQSGLLVLATVIVLVVVQLVVLAGELGGAGSSSSVGGRWSSSLSFIAFGPWLLLQLIVFQNVARTAAVTGWQLPLTAFLMIAGNGLSLLVLGWLILKDRISGTYVALAAILLITSQSFPDATGLLAGALVVLGQISSAVLFMRIVMGASRRREGSSLGPLSASFAIGSILFLLLAFAYYVSYDLPLGFGAQSLHIPAAILLALGAFLAPAEANRKPRGSTVAANMLIPATIGAALLLVPAILWLTWKTPQPQEPADKVSFRLMDYNLHNGYDTNGHLNLEKLAQVIEEQDPDIVGLQEVSRGWLINGSADMLLWLSQRLDMPYVWGPTAGKQWGNAILSKYPVTSYANNPLPPESLLLNRGYIDAQIDLGPSVLRVINSHFHHLGDGTLIRQEHVATLIPAWGGTPRTVIMGDLNAEPDSLEMRLLASAGLVDVARAIGRGDLYTFSSNDPQEKIDYFWITQDLIPSDFSIPQSTSSDHLPLVTTVTLLPVAEVDQ